MNHAMKNDGLTSLPSAVILASGCSTTTRPESTVIEGRGYGMKSNARPRKARPGFIARFRFITWEFHALVPTMA